MISFRLRDNPPATRPFAVALRMYLRYLDAEGLLSRMKCLSLLQRALMRCIVFSGEPAFGRRLRGLTEEKR